MTCQRCSGPSPGCITLGPGECGRGRMKGRYWRRGRLKEISPAPTAAPSRCWSGRGGGGGGEGGSPAPPRPGGRLVYCSHRSARVDQGTKKKKKKITQTEPPNNNCENKRATELAESQGRLQSLIKQGIMGLYGDYHYRPLCESSTNIFCPP